MRSRSRFLVASPTVALAIVTRAIPDGVVPLPFEYQLTAIGGGLLTPGRSRLRFLRGLTPTSHRNDRRHDVHHGASRSTPQGVTG